MNLTLCCGEIAEPLAFFADWSWGGGNGGALGIFALLASGGILVFIIELRVAEGMEDEGLELPDAAAFPEMADNALGVFLAALGRSPFCIFGT